MGNLGIKAGKLSSAETIRYALRSLPALAATSTGNPPKLEQIFFPDAHAEVLDPDVSLVVGNRGMGKTFWTLALADEELRPIIARQYLAFRHLRLDDLEVHLGFSDAEGSAGAVSRHELETIALNIPTEYIWRAVIIRELAVLADADVPKNFKRLVSWVKDNPDKQLAVLRSADRKLVASNKRVLFLFDQLDQVATNWNRIQELTGGLMKIALAMRSYKSIKTKMFIRPDQAENKQIFQFPDASKIVASSRRLSWRVVDLYGLLFFEIMRFDQIGGAFNEICKRAGVKAQDMSKRAGIPVELVTSQEKQEAVFELIAGEFMGKGAKQGRTYSWIPTHLADGRGEISPRVFLKVMQTAAETMGSLPTETAITYEGIQEGVRHASSARLEELAEDYPWVSSALEPLRGSLVPCEREEILMRWRKAKTADEITGKYSGTSAPLDLVLANLIGEQNEEEVLLKLLREIAVLEERSNGKINVPDIFRVKAGILRKGGLTPQQRRRL